MNTDPTAAAPSPTESQTSGRPAPAGELVEEWTLHHDNDAAWSAAKALIAEARDSVAMEQFILAETGIGREILDLLTEKARKGVKVNVLADGFGSRSVFDSDGARELIAAGGRLKVFHGFRAFRRNPLTVFRRLHRKTIICDSDRLMVGGSCFAPRMQGWRDTMTCLTSKALAGGAISAFNSAWDGADGRHENYPPPLPEPASPLQRDWAYLVTTPYLPDNGVYYDFLLHHIRGARKRILLTTPYLAPTKELREALASAVGRGVRVRLLFPDRSDYRPIDPISHWNARRLARAGVDVAIYDRGMFHAKLAVFDGDIASVGSFNLSVDSTRLNLDSGIASLDPDFIETLAGQIEEDFAAAQSS